MSDEKKEQWGEVGKWKMKRKQLASLPGKDCRRNFLEILGFSLRKWNSNGTQAQRYLYCSNQELLNHESRERKWVLGRESLQWNETIQRRLVIFLITINDTACRLQPRDNDCIISNFILKNTPWKIKSSDGQGGHLVLMNCRCSILWLSSWLLHVGYNLHLHAFP